MLRKWKPSTTRDTRDTQPSSVTGLSPSFGTHRDPQFSKPAAGKICRMSVFALESTAFENTHAIPSRHTCDGEDVSPPLRWANLPEGTRSLALVVEDPDAPAGVFTHWIAWGIDSGAYGLGEGEAAPREGRNDFGTTGYRGPCPPPRHGRHRYLFRLYALDVDLDLRSGAGKADLEQAIEGQVLMAADLVGTYER
jgi:Raf kinase inhibitor-like YbhB/YbcL family protein